MASIVEFYSQNLALEVNKGVIQKLRNGGTPSKAPIGYRNIRATAPDGREYRTVEVDETKAAMIRWAFHTYAAGDTTLSQITKSLNILGLRSTTTSGNESPGMTVSRVQRMLRHPYYKGVIVWRGVEYPGNHDRLVEPAVWTRVQACLTANRVGQGARMRHPHHLSGVLKCGHCGASMVASHSRSHTGKVYAYFICNGRNNKTTDCIMKAAPITVVEDLVDKLYAEITLAPAEAERTRARLRHEAAPPDTEDPAQDQSARRAELERQQHLLLDAYYHDAIRSTSSNASNNDYTENSARQRDKHFRAAEKARAGSRLSSPRERTPTPTTSRPTPTKSTPCTAPSSNTSIFTEMSTGPSTSRPPFRPRPCPPNCLQIALMC
ncbi:recombinase family protein [Microbacterium sp.]|uniref:recombinase family protein n=1 Tax=Microbacterium sp. TaxID=51671 RepID=UPI003C789267